jgi:D-tyrosyl-tRNA(Tyr) deacylase
MRFVIQRVLEGSVTVSNEVVGKIGKGLVVLFGLTHDDKYEDLDFAANKLLNIRLFDDENGVRWKYGVKELNLELLIVSQFTLYGYLKGNKPDFHWAMEPEKAKNMYNKFLDILEKKHPGKIQAGKFGEMMQVGLINDGPVTINWDYPDPDALIDTNKNAKKQERKEKYDNKKKIKEENQESVDIKKIEDN